MRKGLIALVFACSSAAFAEPPRPWPIDYESSAIRFRAEQAGAEFEGGFEAFEATIRFDPQDLEHSFARAEIRTSSINTRNADRDEVLRSKEWFHPERWPLAVFETTGFRERSHGGYEAQAKLTIRGVTRDVVLRFDVTRGADGRERLEGEAIIGRLDYGLGEGEWADTEWVGDAVTVKVRIVRAGDTDD